MLPRASLLEPSRQAVSRFSMMMRTASTAKRSAMGWWFTLQKPSRAWARASRPVFMVVRGGTVMVRDGSTMAAVGMKRGLLMVRFSLPRLMTETWVTSAPVPAVVGTAMMVSGWPGKAASPV